MCEFHRLLGVAEEKKVDFSGIAGRLAGQRTIEGPVVVGRSRQGSRRSLSHHEGSRGLQAPGRSSGRSILPILHVVDREMGASGGPQAASEVTELVPAVPIVEVSTDVADRARNAVDDERRVDSIMSGIKVSTELVSRVVQTLGVLKVAESALPQKGVGTGGEKKQAAAAHARFARDVAERLATALRTTEIVNAGGVVIAKVVSRVCPAGTAMPEWLARHLRG